MSRFGFIRNLMSSITTSLLLSTTPAIVLGDLAVKPSNTSAMIGSTVMLHCITTREYPENKVYWTRKKPGDTGSVTIYQGGSITKDYVQRYSVSNSTFGIQDLNSTFGIQHLIISNVSLEDAGNFTCIDNDNLDPKETRIYGSAELVVIDGSLECTDNINTNGTLTNDICDMSPDYINVTCSLTYRGNISPILKWRLYKGDEESYEAVPTSSQNSSGSMVISTVVIQANSSMNGLQFMCDARAGWNESISLLPLINQWKSAPVISLHLSYNKTATNVTNLSTIQLECFVTTNLNCQYIWRNEGKNASKNGKLVTIHAGDFEGMNQCSVECIFRSKKCQFNANIFHLTVTEKPVNSMTDWQIAVVVVGCIFIIFIPFIIILVKRCNNAAKTGRAEEDIPLNPPNAADANDLDVQRIKEAISIGDMHVCGVTIIKDKIFVLTPGSIKGFSISSVPNLDGYYKFEPAKETTFQAALKIPQINAGDLVSCLKYKCIYILYRSKGILKMSFSISSNASEDTLIDSDISVEYWFSFLKPVDSDKSLEYWFNLHFPKPDEVKFQYFEIISVSNDGDVILIRKELQMLQRRQIEIVSSRNATVLQSIDLLPEFDDPVFVMQNVANNFILCYVTLSGSWISEISITGSECKKILNGCRIPSKLRPACGTLGIAGRVYVADAQSLYASDKDLKQCLAVASENVNTSIGRPTHTIIHMCSSQERKLLLIGYFKEDVKAFMM